MESVCQSYRNRELMAFGFVCLFLAYGILVPRPGSEPGHLAMRVQSPNHWTTREFPRVFFVFF